jgi:hypothetical protein
MQLEVFESPIGKKQGPRNQGQQIAKQCCNIGFA